MESIYTVPACVVDSGVSGTIGRWLVGATDSGNLYLIDNVRMLGSRPPISPVIRLWKVDGAAPMLNKSWHVVGQWDGVLISSKLSTSRRSVAVLKRDASGENQLISFKLSDLSAAEYSLKVECEDDDVGLIALAQIVAFEDTDNMNRLTVDTPSSTSRASHMTRIYTRIEVHENHCTIHHITTVTLSGKLFAYSLCGTLYIVEKAPSTKPVNANSNALPKLPVLQPEYLQRLHVFDSNMDYWMPYELNCDVGQDIQSLIPSPNDQHNVLALLQNDSTNAVSISEVELKPADRRFDLVPTSCQAVRLFRLPSTVDQSRRCQLDVNLTQGTSVALFCSTDDAGEFLQHLVVSRGRLPGGAVCPLKSLVWHAVQRLTTGVAPEEIAANMHFKANPRLLCSS